MVERVIRTLKEQCVHRHRVKAMQHASGLVGDWKRFYNYSHPPQTLKMRTLGQAFRFSWLICVRFAGSMHQPDLSVNCAITDGRRTQVSSRASSVGGPPSSMRWSSDLQTWVERTIAMRMSHRSSCAKQRLRLLFRAEYAMIQDGRDR